MDITFISLARDFVRLAAVVHWFSQRVLSYRVSITMEAGFCLEALNNALTKCSAPGICDTDQGSHQRALRRCPDPNEIAISMDGRGAWRDNVFVERIWKLDKCEEVYLNAEDGVAIARLLVADTWIFIVDRAPISALTGACRTRGRLWSDDIMAAA